MTTKTKRRTVRAAPRKNRSTLARHVGTTLGIRWAMRSVLRSKAMQTHPFLTMLGIAGLAYLGLKAGQQLMRRAPATAGLLRLVA